MKITVEEWAAKHYSKPPSSWVLGKWRREGQIYPPPERVGRDWFVDENAKRLVNGIGYVPLGDRIKNAA